MHRENPQYIKAKDTKKLTDAIFDKYPPSRKKNPITHKRIPFISCSHQYFLPCVENDEIIELTPQYKNINARK